MADVAHALEHHEHADQTAQGTGDGRRHHGVPEELELVWVQQLAHCGYSAVSGTGQRSSNCSSAAGSPPSASVIVAKSNRIRPSHECSPSPGSPGRSSSRNTSTYSTPPSLPICSSTGLGNTSEPKIAGTLSRRTCSISSATSRAVGSSKSDTWMAPIIVQS